MLSSLGNLRGWVFWQPTPPGSLLPKRIVSFSKVSPGEHITCSLKQGSKYRHLYGKVTQCSTCISTVHTLTDLRGFLHQTGAGSSSSGDESSDEYGPSRGSCFTLLATLSLTSSDSSPNLEESGSWGMLSGSGGCLELVWAWSAAGALVLPESNRLAHKSSRSFCWESSLFWISMSLSIMFALSSWVPCA